MPVSIVNYARHSAIRGSFHKTKCEQNVNTQTNCVLSLHILFLGICGLCLKSTPFGMKRSSQEPYLAWRFLVPAATSIWPFPNPCLDDFQPGPASFARNTLCTRDLDMSCVMTGKSINIKTPCA